MTENLYRCIAHFRQTFIPSPGRVLEVGSLDVNGSVRPLFADASEYIGIDIQAGPCVDLVLNGHQLLERFGPNSFDTILCLETLEHDDQFWLTLEQLKQALKAGGNLIISTPSFGFGEHRHPRDYYRFGQDAYQDVFFEGLELLELQQLTDSAGQAEIAAVGRKR